MAQIIVEQHYSIPASPCNNSQRSWVMLDDVTQSYTNVDLAFLLLLARDFNPAFSPLLRLYFTAHDHQALIIKIPRNGKILRPGINYFKFETKFNFNVD